MTGAQNDASAKPPCTRTTVGVSVDSLLSVFLSGRDCGRVNLGPSLRSRVRRVTDVFRSMTYASRPNSVLGRCWRGSSPAVMTMELAALRPAAIRTVGGQLATFCAGFSLAILQP